MANLKNTTFFLIAILLICSMLTANATRPDSSFINRSPTKLQSGEEIEGDEGCEGIGMEECLLRRTLIAHTDYVYTEHHKP